MTERQTGLRFDIYERVHLGEHAVGVEQLDEVELVPHIQVYTEGEHALLRGNLYLTGIYAGETGTETRTLEHLIPVEITLPLNRIHDVNQVYVDIDSFDVDLLTPRSLNVTGVLTLHGIEMLTVPDESWQEEEETVFVSRAAELGEQQPVQEAVRAVEAVRDVQASEVRSVPEEPQPAAAVEEVAVLHAEEARDQREPQEEEPRLEEPSAVETAPQTMQEDVAEFYLQADGVNEAPLLEDADEEANAPAAVEPIAIEEPAAVQEPEEKKELKIAFGSKPSPEPTSYLKSIIHTGEARSTAAPEAAERQPELTAPPRTDALEWKRLFARGEGEEQKFSRVRVCIVQKEETLDSIAQRYSKNPREILLYNRVTEQDLAEGKVLFIPR